jgi:hypothetical protein
MKKSMCSFLLIFILSSLPTMADTLDAPVILTHELTSSFQGATASTHNYTIHVRNPGVTALTGLQLTLLPLPHFNGRRIVLDLAFLGPQQSADLDVGVVTTGELDSASLARTPFLFSGKCTDALGQALEFQAKSYLGPPRHTGGAK